MKSFVSKYETLILILGLFIIAAILYLARAGSTFYYDDDWYSMYAARVAGPQIFHQFYAMDSRPLRAYVMIPLYVLFKGNPLYYAFSAYLFRVLGVLTLWWMLRLVWPENKKETFLAAFLFLVYPGFLSQPVAVDFQSHLVGIWLAFLSIGLSIRAVDVRGRLPRLLLWAGALLTGWAYLGLMEYYVGFEAARLLLILALFLRKAGTWRAKVFSAIKFWLPYAAIPAVFLFWRLFIFEGQRRVTDVGAQLGKVLTTPAHTVFAWLIYYVQDVVNVAVLAWGVPLSQLGFDLRLRDSTIALALSAVVLVLFFAVLEPLARHEETTPGASFAREGLWVGSIWVLAGLVFVTLANRHVVFPEYSRYGFVSAGGAVILLTALLARISDNRIRSWILAFLLVSATVTHYANSTRFADLAADIRGFWWQVSWRVPNFEAGTTIAAHYPNGGIRETSFVWGPANQIYFPEGASKEPVRAGIAAMLLNNTTLVDILTRQDQYAEMYYLVETDPDPRHVIVISQPGPQSCVQVIDGRAPEYSSSEDPLDLVVGSYSDTSVINVDAAPRQVPAFLFGAEPAHGWCYYYEKAALARQRGDWAEILRLSREALAHGYRPDDLIEWMPFLQAYARSGDLQSLQRLSGAIRSDRFVARQTCAELGKIGGLQADVKLIIQEKYCQP